MMNTSMSRLFQSSFNRPLKAAVLAPIALIGMVLSSQLAVAQAIYQYTGNNFTYFTGVYASVDRVTATLQFNDPLPPNLGTPYNLIDVTNLPGFSLLMSDGVHTAPFPPAPGLPSITQAAVSTDAEGHINGWSVYIDQYDPARSFNPVNFIGTVVVLAPPIFAVTADSALDDYGTIDKAYIQNAPGTWSASPATAVRILIALVRSMNIQKLGSSLTDQLQQVATDIDTNNGLACQDLLAFVNHVTGQTGNKITTAQTAQILAEVSSIAATLNCS